jgi:PAS domain S-box-containing protein
MQHRDHDAPTSAEMPKQIDRVTELIRREASVQALLARMPGGAIFIVDQELRYRVAEGEALRRAGLRPEQFVGKTLFEALEPALAASYAARYRAALAGTPFAHEHHSHGRWYHSHGIPLADANNVIEAVLVVSYDITERKQVEMAGRQTQERLQLALDAAHLGTFIWYPAEDRAEADDRMLALFGLPPDGTLLLATGLPALLHADDRARYAAAIAQALDPASSGQLQIDIRIVLPDGSERWLAITGQAAFADGVPHQPLHLSGVAADITGRKRREAHLAFLAEIDDTFAQHSTADAIMDAVGAKIGAYLGVTTCTFVDVDDSGNTATVSYAWNSSAVPSTKGTYRLSEFLNEEFGRAHRAGEMVVVHNTQTDPRTDGPSYAAFAIAAFVTVPYLRDNRWTNHLGISDARPRVWRDDELELIAELAQRIFPRLDRAKSESALRLSEARLRLALDLAELGTWSWELATGRGDLDPRGAAIIGMSPGSIADVAEAQRASIHPDDLPQVEAAITAGIAHRSDFSLAYRVVLPDGSLRFIASRARLLADEAGRPVQLVGINRDVTDEREAELRLRASEEQYRSLFETMEEGFGIGELVRDEAGRAIDYVWVELNPQLERLSGLERKQVVGRRVSEVLPGLSDWWVQTYERVVATGEAARFERYLDQLDRWYDCTVFPRGGDRFAVLYDDITERKRAEAQQAAVAALNQFRVRLSDALRPLDQADQIILVASRALGEELRAGRVYYGEVEPDDEYIVISPDYYTGDSSTSISGRHRIKDFGAYVFQEIRANRPVVTADSQTREEASDVERSAYRAIGVGGFIAHPLVRQGRLVAVLGVTQATPRVWTSLEVELVRETAERTWTMVERARAEDALRESEARLQVLYAQEQVARAQAEEASRLKDEFLATVSHELRTPLTALLGYAELLQRRRRDEAYVARAAERILRSAKAQAELIEDLLDISRIISGKLRIEPAPIQLLAVIQAALDTVRPMMDAKRLQLQMDLDPGGSAVRGDAGRLQQVVWNLLSNAAKFTPQGGQISVQLMRVGEYAELRVSDTGHGIHPAFLPYVFDRFRQADSSSQRVHGGLGLGLAIVRHLVELHGGAVSAASPGEGKGATFTVRLPLSPLAQRASHEVAAVEQEEVDGEPLPLEGRRVLVVDDQPAILDLLADILTADGATVQACASAVEALGLVRSWQPDVLVCDIAMPGQDGYWLIGQVRQLAPEEGGAIPAVALTAYVRMEDRLRVLAAGFQYYLPKPISSSELRDVIVALVVG